jgi:hypothetical protein
VSAFKLEAISEGFQAVATLEGAQLTIAFSGNGDMHAIELLAGYLTQVQVEALRLPVHEVRCDFRKLVFMNSSCFKSFVVWIDSVKNLPQSYKIVFVTEPSVHWKRRSLEALRRLALNIVSIEADAPSA